MACLMIAARRLDATLCHASVVSAAMRPPSPAVYRPYRNSPVLQRSRPYRYTTFIILNEAGISLETGTNHTPDPIRPTSVRGSWPAALDREADDRGPLDGGEWLNTSLTVVPRGSVESQSGWTLLQPNVSKRYSVTFRYYHRSSVCRLSVVRLSSGVSALYAETWTFTQYFCTLLS